MSEWFLVVPASNSTDYRIETHTDGGTGLVYAELFYPAAGSTPLARSHAVYASHQEAHQRIAEAFASVFELHNASLPVAAHGLHLRR
ncbi:MAG TPA: hypothetical protein VFB32_10745 [Rudaea sp.]|nr:hypothetical protein [Rudaea sp.]